MAAILGLQIDRSNKGTVPLTQTVLIDIILIVMEM